MTFGEFYKGEKKKLKKHELEKRAQKHTTGPGFTLPQIEIIGKGKKNQ